MDERPSALFYGEIGSMSSWMPHILFKVRPDALEKVHSALYEALPDKEINIVSYAEEMRAAYSDSKYLMSAIKLSAVDYLVKPIGKAELSHAMAKISNRASEEALANTKKGFKAVGSMIFAEPGDIAAIQADGNYSKLVTFDGEDLILESLLSLERRLENPPFVRADRSTIVNLQLVSRLNAQERTCTLLSPDGRSRVIELSKSGIEKLLLVMNPGF